MTHEGPYGARWCDCGDSCCMMSPTRAASMQASASLPVNVRIRLETRAGRSMLVGPFDTLAGARQLARDLIADGSVGSVIVEQQGDDGAWLEVR